VDVRRVGLLPFAEVVVHMIGDMRRHVGDYGHGGDGHGASGFLRVVRIHFDSGKAARQLEGFGLKSI
jgi:hypothetical protein